VRVGIHKRMLMNHRICCTLVLAAAFTAQAGIARGDPGTYVPKVDRPPNIVLIGIDALRADHLGCYGYARSTSPNIDKLAAEGALFENCYSASSWTLPSFVSIFTGLMPAAHGVVKETVSLSPAVPVLPEQLRRLGYCCAAVVSCPMLDGRYGFARGFDRYDDYSVMLGLRVAGMLAPAYKKDPGYGWEEAVTRIAAPVLSVRAPVRSPQ